MVNVIQHPASEAFGLYSFDLKKIAGNDDKSAAVQMTVINIAGWLPLFGSGAGIYRLYAVSKLNAQSKEDKIYLNSMIVRSVAEILFLGPLMMIIDIIITIARACLPKPKLPIGLTLEKQDSETPEQLKAQT